MWEEVEKLRTPPRAEDRGITPDPTPQSPQGMIQKNMVAWIPMAM